MARKNSVEITVSLKDAVTKGLHSVQLALGSLKKNVLNLKTALAGIGSAMALKSLMDASTEQTKAVMGMETAMRSMGRYTPELSQKLQDLASAEQGVTNYGDEMTMTGMKFLVTYRNITDDLLPQTTKTMLDLAALMGGDVVSAANMMGKASMGMVSNLRRVGISVDAATYQNEGYAGVLREINSQVKGQSAAMRAAVGPWTAISNVIGDMKEKAGDIAKEVLNPLGTAILKMLEDADKGLQAFKTSADLHTWATDARNSIMDAVESTILGVAGFADAVKPAIKTMSEVGGRMYAGFKALPDWVQEVGVLGAIFGGRYGMLFLGTMSSLGKEIEIQAAGAASATVGLISWKEMIFSTNKELDALLEKRGLWDAANKASTANTSSPKGPVLHAGDDGRYQVTRPEEDPEADPESATHTAQAWIAKFRAAFTEAEGKLKTTVTTTMGNVAAAASKASSVLGEVKLSSLAKAELAKFQAMQKTQLAEMDKDLDDHLISVEEYYTRKEAMVKAANEAEVAAIDAKYEYEIGQLKKKIATESDLAAAKTLKDKLKEKELALNTELYTAEEKYLRNIIKLEGKRAKEVKSVAEKKRAVKSAIRDAAQAAESAGDYGGDYDLDIIPQLKREEEALKDHHAQVLEDMAENGANQEQINAALEANKQELLKRTAKVDYDIMQQRLGWASTAAGSMAGIFSDLAESGIGNSKKYFEVYKAFAIVETMISTYSAAMGAYQSASLVPYVGYILGPIAAASAIATGMAKVAAIRASEPSGYAMGGLIDGPDQGARADNVTIKATPGEYMMDRPTVAHYGVQAMEALRQHVIPRELFSNLALPAARPAYAGAAFAYGGQVGSSGSSDTSKQSDRPISIVNVLDPKTFDKYMASSSGQRTVLNVISKNQGKVNTILDRG